jgi:hypothetical protein
MGTQGVNQQSQTLRYMHHLHTALDDIWVHQEAMHIRPILSAFM